MNNASMNGWDMNMAVHISLFPLNWLLNTGITFKSAYHYYIVLLYGCSTRRRRRIICQSTQICGVQCHLYRKSLKNNPNKVNNPTDDEKKLWLMTIQSILHLLNQVRGVFIIYLDLFLLQFITENGREMIKNGTQYKAICC